MDPRAFSNIDYVEAIVPKRADEQPLTGRIKREMIDAALHVGKRYRLCECKWRFLLGFCAGGNTKRRDQHNYRRPDGTNHSFRGELTVSSPETSKPPFIPSASCFAGPRPQ